MNLKSNEPFWLVKNGMLNSYASLREDITCDVLIVGSGITGSLIAHQCVEDGYDVVVIDRREVCNGSSSATTSMLQYEIDTPLFELIDLIGKKGAEECYWACSEAIDILAKLSKKIKSKAGFKYNKSLYYASEEKHIDMLLKEYEARKNAGFKVTWLDEAELKWTYKLQNAYGAILSEQGASVDAYSLANELLIYNQARGLKIFDKTQLDKVEYKNNTCIVKTNNQSLIHAKRIIYCVGFESAHMIKEKFVKLISSYALVSEVNRAAYKDLKKTLIWNTASPYLYMRTTKDGRLLIGGEDEPFRDPIKRDVLLDKKERKLLKAVQAMFPHIEFYPDFVWAGTFGETQDGLPYIGEHKDFPNSYWILGFGGNGITFSAIGMEMVSKWLKGKSHSLSESFKFGR